MTKPFIKPAVEPTPEEKKNGWTAATLTKYLAEREQQQREYAAKNERIESVRVENVKTFDPHSWADD